MKKVLLTLCLTLLFIGGITVFGPGDHTVASTTPIQLIENQPQEADGWIWLNKKSFNYNLSKIGFNGKLTPLAENVIAYGNYVVKGDYIYYNNPKDGDKVYRMKTNGTENKLFMNSKDRVTDVQKDFYLVQDEKTYQSKVIDAKTKKELYKTNDYLMSFGDGNLYYINYNDGNSIYRMTYKGANKTKIATPKSNEYYMGYGVQGKNFYFMSTNGIQVKASDSKTIRYALNQKIETGFITGKIALYKDATSKKIYTYDLVSGKKTDLNLKNAKDIYPMNCGDGFTYYDSKDYNKRIFMSLDGKKTLARGDSASRTNFISADATGVYMTESKVQSGLQVSKDGGKTFTEILKDNVLSFTKAGNYGYYTALGTTDNVLKAVDLTTGVAKTVESSFKGYTVVGGDNVLYYNQNDKWYKYDNKAGTSIEMTQYSRLVNMMGNAVAISTAEDVAYLLDGPTPKVLTKNPVVIRTIYDYSAYLDSVDGKLISYFDGVKGSLGYFNANGAEATFVQIETTGVTSAKTLSDGILYVTGKFEDPDSQQAYKFEFATGNKIKLDNRIKSAYEIQVKGSTTWFTSYENGSVKLYILGTDGKLSPVLADKNFYTFNVDSDFILIMSADKPVWQLYGLDGKLIRDITKDIGNNVMYIPSVAKVGNNLYIDINNQYGRYLKVIDLSK